MDDLLGEDWQAPSKPTPTAPLNPISFGSNYSSLRASPQPPQSGGISPQSTSRPSSTVNGGQKPGTDSFGNLLSLKSQKAGNSMSLQERQKQILEEKRKQQEQQAHLWDNLGSGRGTPEVRGPSPGVAQAQQEEDDILAAFTKAAPVDNASYYPPPPSSTGVSGRNTPAFTQNSQAVTSSGGDFDEDDDPFGLGAVPKQGNGHAIRPAARAAGDEDDILGDLGRPVAERPPKKAPSRPEPEPEPAFENSEVEDPTSDRRVAELVEMGFPADHAKIALAETGGDVQGAVGWLLQQAHEESKRAHQADLQGKQRSPVRNSRSPPRRQRSEQDGMPSWMRPDGRSDSATRRQDSRSPANGDKDSTQVAQELGSKLFKGANSLWKASQKQMAKTMAEFQQERDSSQPRWMQETSADSSRASSQRRHDERPVRRPAAKHPADVTDEAAMLDMPREDRPAKATRPPVPTAEQFAAYVARGGSPTKFEPRPPSPQPRFMQQAPQQQDKRPATKLSRQEVEDQSAQAYVSPARRKRQTPKPEFQPAPEVNLFTGKPVQAPASSTISVPRARPEPEVDLFSPAHGKASTPTTTSAPVKSRQAPSTTRSTPAPVRPKAPPRSIPSVSPTALAGSAKHRKAGGEAFKRGDYAAAHEAYTAALTPLPATHPIMIIVLSNRSLTALKTGDAKTAVSDADRAIAIIGASQGSGETIDLGAGEGTKDMRDFFGKALMRKAEALEHMEKWTDAASVWRQAVEAGVGGAVSLRGRDRCEKAAAPKAATGAAPARSATPAARKAPPSKGMGNSMQRPTITSAVSAEAVKKLRAANAAAEKADDERFALTDQVEARLTAWKGGKADNLRALLQSLDGVLWEGAGWKKVGMSDLVMPNKVKIVYMKAIGKVHPDKIPQDATTEQRMVSAAVFSTLNEAWDKFKKDNNL